jgi:tagatose 6-phosphate kinase
MRILTVTLNLALDVTYAADRVQLGDTSRVRLVGRQAGGKGVNVARVLHALGYDAIVTGPLGGFTGEAAGSELVSAGLRHATVPIAGDSRITIMVTQPDGRATGFSEFGPEISAAEWRRFLTRFGGLVRDAGAVVLAGSVPPSIPIDGYFQILSIANGHGVPALLDADGERLMHGLRARPSIVSINAAELAGVQAASDVVAGAQALRSAGAEAVVISEGAFGLVAVTASGVWRAAPPEALTGNPTGAGDAASAALIVGLLNEMPWPERLADAAALSAASVVTPVAGRFDEAVYERLRNEIVAEEVVQVESPKPGS